MPTPQIEEYLRSLDIPDDQKADAWDALYSDTPEEQLRTVPNLSDEQRAELWDLRFSPQQTEAIQTEAPVTEAPDTSIGAIQPVASHDVPNGDGTIAITGAALGKGLQSEPLRRGARMGISRGAIRGSRMIGGPSMLGRASAGAAIGATIGGGAGALVGAPFAGATVGSGIGGASTASAGRHLGRHLRSIGEAAGRRPIEEAAAIAGELGGRSRAERARAMAATAANKLKEATGGPTIDVGKAALAQEDLTDAGKLGRKAEARARQFAVRTGRTRGVVDRLFGRAPAVGNKLASPGVIGRVGQALGPAGVIADTVLEQGPSQLPFQGGFGHRPVDETPETTAARQAEFGEQYQEAVRNRLEGNDPVAGFRRGIDTADSIEDVEESPGAFLLRMLGNVPSSAINTGRDVVQGAGALAGQSLSLPQEALETVLGLREEAPEAIETLRAAPGAITEHFVSRYGSPGARRQTVAEDPAGVALDAVGVAAPLQALLARLSRGASVAAGQPSAPSTLSAPSTPPTPPASSGAGLGPGPILSPDDLVRLARAQSARPTGAPTGAPRAPVAPQAPVAPLARPAPVAPQAPVAPRAPATSAAPGTPPRPSSDIDFLAQDVVSINAPQVKGLIQPGESFRGLLQRLREQSKASPGAFSPEIEELIRALSQRMNITTRTRGL